MPDLGQVPPVAGGAAGAAGRPDLPGARGAGGAPEAAAAGFKARLEAKLAARRVKGAVPPEHVAELIRLFSGRGEAFASARLITKYPVTEKDDALYEVRTDRGTHRAIRGRDGTYTIF
jgi:hypothetical protein